MIFQLNRNGAACLAVRHHLALALFLCACSPTGVAGGAPSLQSVSVLPGVVSVAVGIEQRFTVTGRFSDGSSVALTSGIAWSSSDSAIATIDADGLAHGVAVGTVTITATQGATGRSSTASLTVTAAALESIDIAPASSTLLPYQDAPLGVTGRYTDGTSAALITGITWSSSSSAIATIDAAGLAHAVAPGTVTITAIHGATGLSSSASLTVAAAVLESLTVLPATPSVAAGLTERLTVRGHYSDGATTALTSGITWSSSSAEIASIDAGGLARGLAEGTTTLSATHTASGLSGAVTLTVSEAVPESISLTPTPISLVAGLCQQMVATEHVSDGRVWRFEGPITPAGYSLAWTSTDPTVATVNRYGDVTALAPGSAIITVTDTEFGLSDTASVTVTPAVYTVSITPGSASVPVGGEASFMATGKWSNQGSVVILLHATWSSSNPALATVSSDGLVRGVAPGTVAITATDNTSGLSASASLTVTEP